MPSPALDAFTAWVDSTNLSTNNKNAAKARGVTLYTAATQEEAAHVLHHLDAEIPTAAGDELTHLQRLRAIYAVITTDQAPSAHEVATYILTTTDAERAWGRALGSLMVSRTLAEASAYFDVLLQQYDSPAIRTRLLLLRDLITAKLGA
jgi:hypothetical protein